MAGVISTTADGTLPGWLGKTAKTTPTSKTLARRALTQGASAKLSAERFVGDTTGVLDELLVDEKPDSAVYCPDRGVVAAVFRSVPI